MSTIDLLCMDNTGKLTANQFRVYGQEWILVITDA